jgi:diguanylate cyclase (GGDEF)-like protein
MHHDTRTELPAVNPIRGRAEPLMGPTPLHATLRRQLRRLRLDPAKPPATPAQWADVLASIDRVYREADELVYLVTNSERMVTDELARSQQDLALAQRLAGLGSWTFDALTGKGTISDELANLLELDGGQRQMSVEWLIEFVVPAEREAVRQMLESARVAPTHRTSEIRFVTRTGRECWCLCRMASHADANAQIVRVDGTVLDISDRRAAEERTRQLARTDPLTGLANRAHFFHLLGGALDAARQNHTTAAVVFIDLDGFKTVNDTCGHHVGDALLETVARRLRACLRGSDVVGRFGGDEFVLLLQGLGTQAEVSLVTDKVLRACATSVTHGRESVSVSASVGVALYPGDSEDAEQLLKSADAAMYVAKETGRNNVRFFGAEVRARRHSDRSMLSALRAAIAHDEIRVAYQPIVDGNTREILGLEALARWTHPPQGAIAPVEFIALAEETGLIGSLCQRVAVGTCRELVALPPAVRGARWVSINVSPVQLRSPDFIKHFRRMLAETGVDPTLLRLEITENAVMHDPELAIRMLNQIKSLGVSIWLDDFGTGHSSLAYLRRLPVDCIKVDRSFVNEIQGTTAGPLLQGIISMARSVGCEVLAEGVETESQREALLAAGCTLMQGYLFGKPDRFDRWMGSFPAAEVPAPAPAGGHNSSSTPASTTPTEPHSNPVTVSPANATPSSIAITGLTKV